MAPDRPTSTTNELAKARNRAAAERTLTSWIQNSLVLIGFGTAFDRIFAAIRQTFPESPLPISDLLAQTTGLGTVAIGLLLLVLAIQTYRAQMRLLGHPNYLNQAVPHQELVITVGAVVLFGTVALFAIVVLMADAS